MRNQGIVAGILGCLFGVLGILTIGILFVPIAGLCSLIGLIRGISGPSLAGIATSLLGAALTIFGFISSPTLWLFAAGLFVATQSDNPATSQPKTSAVETATPDSQSESSPKFDIASNASSLPHSGPKSWCRQSEVIQNIMIGLNSTTAVQHSGEHVIDFENALRYELTPSRKRFHVMGLPIYLMDNFCRGHFLSRTMRQAIQSGIG
jgi:hypothetical protein